MFTAEERHVVVSSFRLREASMGPRLFTAEESDLEVGLPKLLVASMGPRLFTAEEAAVLLRLPWGPSSFNGAAVVHRGRDPAHVHRFDRGYCFNGAAVVHRGRG